MKLFCILILLLCALFVVSACEATPDTVATPTPSPQINYKDGTYTVTTDKDWEGYYAKAILTVKDGKITDFNIDIYDSRNSDVLFDDNYENYMTTEYYKQQCREDLAGLRSYMAKLVDTQSKDDIDAISGATWAWKWFNKVAANLLEQATAKN